MKYSLKISHSAIEQLRALPKEVRRNVGYRIEGLCEDLQGDVKKLKGQAQNYRLRVCGFRVLFTLEGNAISVYGVKDRKDAYE